MEQTTATTTTAAARLRIKPSIPERVASLREWAEHDPINAQDAAWAWFARLGELTLKDRERGVEQLDRLFAEGQVPEPIDGITEGMMMAYLFGPHSDRAIRKIGALWMPWLGKRFDAERQHGENRVTRAFPLFTRLVWPGYAVRAEGNERRGFEFETHVEQGAVEPDVHVLVIDYGRVPENPARIVPSIRDELVQIVPGTYLGRALWRGRNGTYKNCGFFALRNEGI
jgi:hypothetical protein